MGTGSVNVGGRMVPPSEAGTQASKEAERIRNSGGGGVSGGGGSCFPGDALILTPSGWQSMRQISNGMSVASLGSNGCVVHNKVLKKKAYGISQILEIEGIDGQRLFKATAGHSVLSSSGWRRVGKLTPGEKLTSYDRDGKRREDVVGSVLITQTPEEVFNLVVAGDYNFIVKGCTAHSFTYFRTVRMAYWTARSWLAERYERLAGRLPPASTVPLDCRASPS